MRIENKGTREIQGYHIRLLLSVIYVFHDFALYSQSIIIMMGTLLSAWLRTVLYSSQSIDVLALKLSHWCYAFWNQCILFPEFTISSHV